MNTTRLKLFRKAFRSHDWTPRQRRHYARQWVQSIRALGPKWLLSSNHLKGQS